MTPDPQPPAVVVATPTILSGLVVRWRAVVNGGALLSASRARVMIHGDVDLARIEPWLDDARRAHEALRAGRDGEARALATHRYARLLGALVPIGRSEEPKLSEVFTEPVPVPVGELVAFGLAMEEAQRTIAALRAENAELRQVTDPEIEAAMRDAALEKFGDVIRDATDAAVMPRLAEIEAAARASERERIRTAADDLKFTLWRGPGQEQALDVVPLADLLGLLGGG